MNFGEVKEQVAKYLGKDELVNQIPFWINTAQRNVETQYNFGYMKELAATILATQDFYVKIANNQYKNTIWLKTKAEGENEWHSLQHESPSFVRSAYPNYVTDVGMPKIFCYLPDTANFLVRPTPDRKYHFEHYYHKYSPELENNLGTNWLTDNASKVLIYGALLEASPYLQMDARLATWAELLSLALESLRTSELEEAYSGSSLKLKSYYCYR